MPYCFWAIHRSLLSCLLFSAIFALVYLLGVRQSSHKTLNIAHTTHNFQHLDSKRSDTRLGIWKTRLASTNVGFFRTESPRLFSRLLPLAIFALDYHFGVRQSSHKITNKLAHDTWTRKRGTKLSEVRKMKTNRSKRHMHRYKAVPEFLLGVPTFHFIRENRDTYIMPFQV